MIGIYLIKNEVNGKVYIGQSTDIHRRWCEHLRSGQPEKYALKNDRDSNTPIHRAMQKYGIERFTISILEECKRQELNEKERYWIEIYQSQNKEKGYNLSKGGQESFGLTGENHSQAKLSQEDVNNIKQLLRNTNLTLGEIVEKFPWISKPTISMINQGKIWYDSKEKYPIRIMEVGSKGSKNPKAKFTETQVMEMRKLYSEGVSPKIIHAQFNSIASDSAINAILYNKTYTHLPRWNKKEKKWF